MEAVPLELPHGLLERERALDRARRRLEGLAGGVGGVLAVQGPPGVGKSSLLHGVRRLAGPDVRALSARGAQLETDLAYGVVRQLLERTLLGLPPARRERVFGGAARFARAVFDLEDVEAPAAGDTAARTLHALYWVAVGLAEEAPLLLLVDDLQWADRSSLRFLAFLAERIDELPVCLAVAHRDHEPGAPEDLLGAVTARADVLELAPLSLPAVSELVREALGPPEPDFVAACLEVSGGNPLYVRELLRELADLGVSPDRSGIDEARRVTPAAVSRSVPRRLAGLPDACRPLATAVAVLGDGTSLAAARQLAGIDAEAASGARDALVRAGILAPRGDLAFTHPILRGAFYAQLAPSERAAAHERAARIMRGLGEAPAAVAAHLLASEPSGEAGTVAELRRAAEDAMARGANEAAVAYLRRAVAEPPRQGERSALLALLGRAEHAVGDPASVEHLYAARDAASTPSDRAEIGRLLALALRHQARIAESMEVLEEAERTVRDVDPDAALELLAEYTQVANVGLRLTEELADRLELHASSAGDTHGQRAALAALALVRVWMGRGTVSEAADLAGRALAGDHLLRAHGPGESPLFGGAVMAQVLAGRIQEAHRMLAEGEEDTRRRGSPAGAMFIALMRTSAYLYEGRLADAEAEGRRASDLASAYGMAYGQAWAAGQLALILTARGRTAEVQQLLDGYGFDREIPGGLWFFNLFLFARADLRLQTGDLSDAVADALEVGARGAPEMPWRSIAAEALTRQGERDRAVALAREQLEEARALELTHLEAAALVALGLAEAGDTGVRHLRDAVEVTADTPVRLFHARALVELGAALRRRNERAAARAVLAPGLELADRLGADALAEQATIELRAAGARPRQVVRRGIDALTPSERRVATLAAEGLTNKEIAQSLFVTLKTVELHLTNTYRKLGIASRRDISAALAGSDAG